MMTNKVTPLIIGCNVLTLNLIQTNQNSLKSPQLSLVMKPFLNIKYEFGTKIDILLLGRCFRFSWTWIKYNLQLAKIIRPYPPASPHPHDKKNWLINGNFCSNQHQQIFPFHYIHLFYIHLLVHRVLKTRSRNRI